MQLKYGKDGVCYFRAANAAKWCRCTPLADSKLELSISSIRKCASLKDSTQL